MLCTTFHFTQSAQHEYTEGLKYGDNKGHYINVWWKRVKSKNLPSHLVVLLRSVIFFSCNLRYISELKPKYLCYLFIVISRWDIYNTSFLFLNLFCQMLFQVLENYCINIKQWNLGGQIARNIRSIAVPTPVHESPIKSVSTSWKRYVTPCPCLGASLMSRISNHETRVNVSLLSA